MKKYLSILALCFMFLLTTSHYVSADLSGSNSSPRVTLDNPFGGAGGTLPDLFRALVDNVLLPIGGVVAVISFIWAGFKFVTAQGDEGKIKEARTALLYTAIGTLILLGAWGITSVITNTINSLKT